MLLKQVYSKSDRPSKVDVDAQAASTPLLQIGSLLVDVALLNQLSSKQLGSVLKRLCDADAVYQLFFSFFLFSFFSQSCNTFLFSFVKPMSIKRFFLKVSTLSCETDAVCRWSFARCWKSSVEPLLYVTHLQSCDTLVKTNVVCWRTFPQSCNAFLWSRCCP